MKKGSDLLNFTYKIFITGILLLSIIITCAMVFRDDNAKFGDVVYSVLPPEQFMKLHQGWELLQGQNIDKQSELGLLGVSRLPDARGLFIRGRDLGRNDVDGMGDPDWKERERPDNLASNRPQKDGFPNHKHGIAKSTNLLYYQEGGNLRGGRESAFMNAINNPNKGGGALLETDNDGGNSSEIRPKNIALYVYIKVN